MSFLFFFFEQKTAYEMRISDWSSDVCSSDLISHGFRAIGRAAPLGAHRADLRLRDGAAAGGGAGPDRGAGGAVPGGAGARGLASRVAHDERSEERCVGKEWVSTCRSRVSPYLQKKNTQTNFQQTQPKH